jgi:tetratricopeptide (TPR) repeat protein
LVFGEIDLAWALAALWGVHPLLTESVTNIVGRADLLMALGVLAGLLCYVKSASAAGKARTAWLAAMVAAQTVGLFSKESAAVLPVLLLLYDLTFGQVGGWRRRVPAYAALMLPFAAYFCMRAAAHTHLEIAYLENPLASAGFWTARLTAVKVIGKLAWLFVWPVRLSADYSFNAVPLFGWRFDWEDAKALVALALCLAAALAAVRWRRSRRTASFFIAFFFVAIAPTANLLMPIGSIMAERFLYLGSIGLAGCAVAALWLLGRRMSRRAVWSATALICLALAARTNARNPDWRDEYHLWASAVKVSPGAARSHNNLGFTLTEMGRLPDAIAELKTALRILPDYAEAHCNLGVALMRSPGRLADAIAEFQETLREEPGYVNAHINLGIALSQIPERAPEAAAEYQAAVRAEPDSAEAHHGLGAALAQMPGRGWDAIAELQTAVGLRPDSAEMHYDLATLLAQAPDRYPEAVAEFREAVRAKPDFAPAHNNLGSALDRMPGHAMEAIDEYRAAVRLQPDYADAHYNLGVALAKQPGQHDAALAELETALRLDHSPQTRQALDWARSQKQ